MALSHRPDHPNLKGITAAATILGGWSIGLAALLSVDLSGVTWWMLPAVLVQTFLYTGLFITAHDGMHGTISPDYPRVNNALGALAVGLYALFSYRKLREAHHRHHRHPASDDDPDYHDGEHDGTVGWYLTFMRQYLSVGQLVGMATVFNLLWFVVGVSPVNLVVFWVVPALASTLQLFYFGTVLPHRQPDEGYDDHHRAQSNDFSVPVSFLTCYHFGYHWEHHERPDLPWWSLPKFRRHRLAELRGGNR